jgi:hypothetical protein
MGNSLTNFIGGLVGWSLIPNFATKALLPVLDKLLGKAVDRQQYTRRYRAVYAFVCLSYLLFNFVESIVSVPKSLYQLLDASPSIDQEGLKIAFRQFARRFHPDRVGEHGTDHFVAVRDGYEILKDPVKRWAYDLSVLPLICIVYRNSWSLGLAKLLVGHV